MKEQKQKKESTKKVFYENGFTTHIPDSIAKKFVDDKKNNKKHNK